MVSRTRGMFSKRSSEWSVKSRSSLTWIDTLKTGTVAKLLPRQVDTVQ